MKDSPLEVIVQRANNAHQNGELTKAEKLYKKALKIDPRHVAANSEMGKILFKTQQEETALTYFRMALEAAPNQPKLWEQYIRSLYQLGYVTEASLIVKKAKNLNLSISDFEHIQADDDTLKKPNSKDTHRLLQLFESKRFSDLLTDSEKLAALYPNQHKLWDIMSIAAIQLHDYEKAEVALKNSVAINPHAIDTLNNLGKVLIERKKLEEAEKTFAQALNLKRNCDQTLNNIGSLHFIKGNYDTAHTTLVEATCNNPKNAEAYNNLGLVDKRLGKLESAIENFKTAIGLNPNFYNALLNLGSTYKASGDFEKSELYFQKAIKVSPGLPEAYYNYANLLSTHGKKSTAITFHRKALEIQPFFFESLTNLASVLTEEGRYSEAIKLYLNAIKLRPNDASVLSSLGVTLEKARDVPKAIQAQLDAIKLDPSLAEPYNNLGGIYRNQRSYVLAKNMFKEALSRKPNYPEAYHNLGVVLVDEGLLDEAIKNFTKALSIDPYYANASYSLGQTYLRQLNFLRGWELCEKRWNTTQPIGRQPGINLPNWSGEKDAKVLVYSEQGIGDVVMFSSTLGDLMNICENVTVLCESKLADLFSLSCKPDLHFLTYEDAISENSFDFQIAIGSLPKFLRTEQSSFNSSSSGFMSSTNLETSRLYRDLRSGKKQKIVGISWKTESTLANALERNVPLELLAKKLTDFGFKLINLQYGDVNKEINSLKAEYGIDILQPLDTCLKSDLISFSKLINCCDHVVTIDNCTAHFAGAFGVCTKLLLPHRSDWRWGDVNGTSYWYDSVSLFRQEDSEDWERAIDEAIVTIV